MRAESTRKARFVLRVILMTCGFMCMAVSVSLDSCFIAYIIPAALILIPMYREFEDAYRETYLQDETELAEEEVEAVKPIDYWAYLGLADDDDADDITELICAEPIKQTCKIGISVK